MQIPINKAKKLLKTISQWSTATLLTCLLYILFISFVLAISFPLKSSKMQLVSNVIETNGDEFDATNEINENQQKLLQRANELPTTLNRSEILKEAFKRYALEQIKTNPILEIEIFCFFFSADLNGDLMLTIPELARYINARIRDHIEASIKNNPILFSEIDRAPHDGLITWDEYYAYFLRTLGYDEKFIKQVDKVRQTHLNKKNKEQIMKDKAMWSEAARTDTYRLTLDEFLAFRHPGISTAIYSNCYFLTL